MNAIVLDALDLIDKSAKYGLQSNGHKVRGKGPKVQYHNSQSSKGPNSRPSEVMSG